MGTSKINNRRGNSTGPYGGGLTIGEPEPGVATLKKKTTNILSRWVPQIEGSEKHAGGGKSWVYTRTETKNWKKKKNDRKALKKSKTFERERST